MPRPLVPLVATLVLAACAPTGAVGPGSQAMPDGERAPRTCFAPQEIVNFRTVRDRTVYVRTLRDDVLEITSAGCPDLDASFGLAITPSIGISDRLCVGDGAQIAVSNPSISRSPCLARVARSLTAAEVEALPARDRP